MTRVQKIIVKKMADGHTRLEVSDYLKHREISPNSLSTIEKEIHKLKKQFNAKSSIHLFVILMRQGLMKI
jgi:DNA-binding CsgD family transcriptional regulator